MITRHKINTVLLPLLAFVLLVSVIYFLGADVYKSPQQSNLVQLENGWTICHAGNTFSPEILSKSDIGMANSGDEITITRTMDDYDVVPATIHFRSILSTIDVYLDGQLIYTFGHDYYDAGKMLPKVEHFVNLPADYPGKELTILFTATERNAFSGMSPITLGVMEDITRSMVQDGRLSLSIAVFLVMFGFMTLVLSPILLYKGNHDLSIAFSGVISVLLGLYILCFNDLFWTFSDYPSLYTFLEYLSLFLLPASILLFLTFARQIRGKKVPFVLGIINYGFAIVTAILHLANLVHICNFVSTLHLIALVEGFYIIASLLSSVYEHRVHPDEFNTRNMSTNMLFLGLVLFLGCSVTDIIKFNIKKYISNGEVNSNINFLTVGALLFIDCLVLNYFFHCIEYINASNMKQKLEGLAYTDALTGISNRSKCELTLAELSGQYTIISVDLDYLKYTNDTYGHLTGDKLLSGFADILRGSFYDASLIGRMGGDEFIIVLPFINDAKLEKEITSFINTMEQKSKTDSPVKYSASYGHASSNDEILGNNPSAQNVYLLADARMYKMKKTHHKQTLGRLYDDLLGKKHKKGGSYER